MKIKRGDLVDVTWIDAHFTVDMDEEFARKAEAGGEVLHAIGYLCMKFPSSIVIVAELDEDRNPSRDFNSIPRSLIKKMRLIRRHTFGEDQ